MMVVYAKSKLLRRSLFLVVAATLFFSTLSHSQSSVACSTREIIARLLPKLSGVNRQLVAPLAATAKKRFGKGVDPSVANAHIMFGFESEYAIDECGKLLEFYAPDPRFGITTEQWLARSESEKIAWVRENVRSQLVNAEMTPLKKIRDVDGFEFMPEQLVLDATGNLEVILPPLQTFEEWHSAVEKVNTRFGVGSMQGMISSPAQAFFGATEQAIEEGVKENLGFLNFVSEYDVLEKLTVGAARFQADPTRPVAQSFNHPFLGPMSRQKQELLESFLRGNPRGQKLDYERHLSKIKTRDSSFKYVGTTVYRPDIGMPQGRVAFEIRDAHKNFDVLFDRMVRATHAIQNGRSEFSAFASVKSFDGATLFETFPDPVKSLLMELFPPRLNPSVPEYLPADRLSLEVYRNFSYPLRDWAELGLALGHPEVSARASQAQRSYVERLNAIAAEKQRGALTAAQASTKVQGALATFAESSGVLKSMQEWQRKKILDTFAHTRFVRDLLDEIKPLAQAIPPGAWGGALNARVERLIGAWPGRVKMVDDVVFKLTQGFNTEKKRKVLVISLEGLSPEDQQRLLTDYLNAMTSGTVSFPLGQRSGHLYTRYGNKTFDNLLGIRTNDYRFGGERLETVLSLTPDEEARLRFYIDSTISNYSDALTRWNYNGPPSGTKLRLFDNGPLAATEGHNCTSWLCTAPIGPESKPIFELVRAAREWNVHTNPGWWTNYVAARAPSERVPFLVYISPLRMEELLIKVQSNKEFSWDFALH